MYVFRSCEKKKKKARQKQKSRRFVPDIGKSMKNDAGVNQTDGPQRTSTIYDLDCNHLGMFALFFSIGMVVYSYMNPTLFNCLQCINNCVLIWS